MNKSDKQQLTDLINDVVAANTQIAVLFWWVLSPEQRREFGEKLKYAITRDEADIPQPSHRTGILKAFLKNLEVMESRQQPSGSVSHLRAVPGASPQAEVEHDKK